MRYCNKCVYPENARPGVVFDNEGFVCSGCRLIESRKHIKWVDRENLLVDLLNEYKKKQRKKNNNYDCIILCLEEKTVLSNLVNKKKNIISTLY